ncbi:hypothetical protein AVEN_128587-1 [Araneus ventricosus]|uniref:Uncharacterized protein n=1 Tax=Araneus ventricosus TaxID=182803 RepID=A0A4Y2KAZ8_ARAVE|nr:hypothetical protein AVEN_128587-1 [Araneus ventricosus]
MPSGIENDIGLQENSRSDPKNSRRTAFLGVILDATDNESLLSNWQTIIRPSGLKEAKFNTWLVTAVLLAFVSWKEFPRCIKWLCME